jgi:hypothetical protein
MVITGRSFVNASGMLITACAHTATPEFKPPPGSSKSRGRPGLDVGY